MPKALESPVMQVTLAPGATVIAETPGPMRFAEGEADSIPGTAQNLVNGVAPISGTWRLRRVELVSRAYAYFTVWLGATVIKTGYTSAATPTISLPIDPWLSVAPTDQLYLTYTQETGPVVPVTGRIYYTENS